MQRMPPFRSAPKNYADLLRRNRTHTICDCKPKVYAALCKPFGPIHETEPYESRLADQVAKQSTICCNFVQTGCVQLVSKT